MAIVSIAQENNMRIAVQKAIRLLGGIENFVCQQDKVVIKPNLVFALPPFTGFTTDYPIVQAIIQLCQGMKPSQIAIAEGSGGYDTKLAFRKGGFLELAKKFETQLVDLNECPTTKVEVPMGYTVQVLQVPTVILECDVLISVPKLKLYKRVPEQRDWVSLAVKNLMGALPGKGKYSSTRPSGMAVECSREFWASDGKFFYPEYKQWWSPQGEKQRIHTNFSQGLVDVHMVIKPALNIIDAFIVNDDTDMSTTQGKEPFALNTILASQDPLALDCIAAKIADINPFDILYLKCAAERGLGESDYKQIQVKGTPLKKIITTWKTALKCRKEKAA